MRRALAIAGLAALFFAGWLAPAPAAAETPAERASKRLEAALDHLKAGQRSAAWQEMEAARRALWPGLKLGIRSLTMVREPAKGYGMYAPRPGNAYSIMGEPIYIYLEPVGYALAAGESGELRFALSMDARLLDLDGRELFALKDFMRQTIYSRRFKGEFFLNVTLNIDGAPPGSYVVQLTLNDLVGGKKATAKLPIRFMSPSAIAIENRRLAAEAAARAHKSKSDKASAKAKEAPAKPAPKPAAPPSEPAKNQPPQPTPTASSQTKPSPSPEPKPAPSTEDAAKGKDAGPAKPAAAPQKQDAPAGLLPTGTN